ncbi:MAG TPA: LamG-like jellyroll fold domain-containing protein [Alphaproteobacteria bacterium]|nr:LamG-like jellyroll fold domain-containing protein [Alphaproteobacteria bacterium]
MRKPFAGTSSRTGVFVNQLFPWGVAGVALFWVVVQARGQTAGLVAVYGFNEASGTIATDASGNGNNGTISGATRTPSGKYGGALVFNGTNAVVTINSSATLQLSTAMTLEAWVNPSVVDSTWRDVIYKGQDNYYLEGTSGNGKVPAIGGTFGGSDTVLDGTGGLPTNTWSYLAATYDGITTRLYVNGVQVASQAQTGPIATSTNPLQIGGDSFYGQFFQGIIDEVRIYDVALTAAQIQTDMNTSLPADTQPPSAPANLAATTVTVSQIDLNWLASTDNVGVAVYLVEREDPGATNFEQIGMANAVAYSDTGLSANSSYTYRVRAMDASGNLSAYSEVATAATPPAPGSLVAAYGFNEGSGTTATDESGTGNTGEVIGPTWTASGKFGGALEFNGSNDWVLINDAPSLHLTNAMTLEAWVYPYTLPSSPCEPAATCYWMDVVHKDSDRYYIEASSDVGQAPEVGGIFADGKHIVIAPSPLATNSWTHLAVTYDGAMLALYVNGMLATNTPVTSLITTSTNPLFIGGDETMGQYFHGRIDEVRVYNRALSGAEIQTDMNTPVGYIAPFQVTSIVQQGNDMLVTWTTVGGKTNVLQAANGSGNGGFSNNFSDIFTVTNTASTVTNYLDAGAATNFPARYYRVRLSP